MVDGMVSVDPMKNFVIVRLFTVALHIFAENCLDASFVVNILYVTFLGFGSCASGSQVVYFARSRDPSSFLLLQSHSSAVSVSAGCSGASMHNSMIIQVGILLIICTA